MKDFFDLNNLFFELYGALYESLEILTSKQYSFIADKLFEQYKVEYEKIALTKKIDDKLSLYEIKKRFNGYVPRGFLFFKNNSKKLTDKEIHRELNEFFEKKRNSLNLSNSTTTVETHEKKD